MLVLKRKAGEKIHVNLPSGECIILTITETEPKATRIGIDAPKHITVAREELLTKQEIDLNIQRSK